MTRVAVVGGGLAGIAAALQCAESGADVALVEARPRLGGATFSVERDGLWLDNGQHVFLRCCTEYLALLARLGVEADVVVQERLEIPVLRPGTSPVWLRRGDLPAPLHLAGAIARFGPLSPLDRVRVARAVRGLQKLSLDDPVLDRITFADWLGRHGQRAEAIAALWNLIALPTVNLPATEASLALAAKVFKTGLLEEPAAADIGYAAVPLQRLHGEAATRALERAGVEVRTGERIESLASLDADGIVLAVPHAEAAALLPEGALPSGVDPRRLGVSPIVNLHVRYDRRVTDLPFAAGLETSVQWLFDRTSSAGLEDGGQLLAVSLSSASGYADTPLDTLRAEFVAALEDLLPAARRARVVSFWSTREPRATFRGVPGTAADRPGPRTLVENLYLAGAWTDTGWPATMEGAVRSGLAAARALTEDAGVRPVLVEAA